MEDWISIIWNLFLLGVIMSLPFLIFIIAVYVIFLIIPFFVKLIIKLLLLTINYLINIIRVKLGKEKIETKFAQISKKIRLRPEYIPFEHSYSHRTYTNNKNDEIRGLGMTNDEFYDAVIVGTEDGWL